MSIGYGPYSGKGMSQLDRIETMLVDLLAKKKPGKPRSSKKQKYPPWFEDIWRAYPKRAGSNPKWKAWCALRARLFGMPEDDAIHYAANRVFNGVYAYKLFCEKTGKTGTEYVMQTATFLGPDKHFKNDWTIPAQADNVPKDDNKLSSWAAERGYRGAWAGESHAQFRRALKTLHRSNDND